MKLRQATANKNSNPAAHHCRLAALTLVTLIALGLYVKFHGSVMAFNVIAHGYMQSWQTPTFNMLALVVSFFGDKIVIYPVIVLFALWLFTQKNQRLAWHWLAAMVFSALIIELLKMWVASPRPDNYLNLSRDFSFPSGHVTLATMWCGFLYITAAPHIKSFQRVLLTCICCLIPILVLLSRVYIGAHWPTDVEAGFFLGIYCYSVVAFSYTRKPEPVITKNQIKVALLLFIIVSCVYATLCHQQLAAKFLLVPQSTNSAVA